MALNGVLVTCGYVGGFGAGTSSGPSVSSHSLLSDLMWSELLQSPSVATQNAAPTDDEASGIIPPLANPAPGNKTYRGQPSFEIVSSVDVYVAKGPAPDPTQAVGTGNSARFLVQAGVPRNIFCRPGDRIAYAVA